MIDMKGTSILIAEDDKTNQEILTFYFDKIGWKYKIVEDGEELLSVLDYNIYSVIILDLQMPKLGGIEAAGIIRENEKILGKKIPIIATSGSDDAEEKKLCRRLGITAYFEKPYRFNDLLDEILRVINFGERNKTVKSGLSIEHLQEKVGYDIAVIEKFLEIILCKYPERIAVLEELVKKHDFDKLAYHMHSFKGSVGMVSERVHKLAVEIEAAAKHSEADTVEEHFIELLDEMKIIMEEYCKKSWKDKGNCGK